MSENPAPDRMRVLQSFKRSLNGYHENAIVQAEIAKSLIDYFLATSQLSLIHI